MRELINEKISVVAVYNRMEGSLKPIRLRWQGLDRTVTEYGLVFKEMRGRILTHVFCVSDGVTYFKLRFDTDLLSWTLEEVHDGLAA